MNGSVLKWLVVVLGIAMIVVFGLLFLAFTSGAGERASHVAPEMCRERQIPLAPGPGGVAEAPLDVEDAEIADSGAPVPRGDSRDSAPPEEPRDSDEALPRAIRALMARDARPGGVFPPGTRLLGCRIEGTTAHLDFSSAYMRWGTAPELHDRMVHALWKALEAEAPWLRGLVIRVEDDEGSLKLLDEYLRLAEAARPAPDRAPALEER